MSECMRCGGKGQYIATLDECFCEDCIIVMIQNILVEASLEKKYVVVCSGCLQAICGEEGVENE